VSQDPLDRELFLVQSRAVKAAGEDDDGAELGRRYRQTMIDARTRQLRMTRSEVNRMMRAWNTAASEIRGRMSGAPEWQFADEEGVIDQARLRVLLRDIDSRIVALAKDYGNLLDAGLRNSAQVAVEREAALAKLVGAPLNDPDYQALLSRQYELSDGSTVGVRFGQIAEEAVQALQSRYYADGLTLSDRLGALTSDVRRAIEDELVQAVTEQVSSSEAGERLARILSATDGDNPGFRAYRIARTEIAAAHREGHIRSCTDRDGAKRPHVAAVGYRLSLSHPKPDICDIWATDDSGLGAGNYEPGDVPIDHCFGLCWTATVLVDLPNVALPVADADVEAVPESQVRYYADKLGDGPAGRRAAALATAAEE